MNNVSADNSSTVLHISADYPDCFNSDKTAAVRSLVDSSSHNNIVISINRQATRWEATKVNGRFISIQYFALPWGVGSRFFLKRLAYKIIDILSHENLNYDLIHAHKFSVEGVIAYYINNKNKKPYIASLWGSTDRKIISMKRECKQLFRSVAYNSTLLLPASPWISNWLQDRLQLNKAMIAVELLPVITPNTAQQLRSSTSQPFKLVSVFNLNLYKLKGLPNLLKALAETQSVTLDIYGTGNSKQQIRQLIEKYRLSNRVTLKGFVDNTQITKTLSHYNAFIMPTTSETFGMVYIEALSAGIPIIYSKEQGIDGYFDDADIGLAVDPTSVNSVHQAILQTIENYDSLKENVASLQQNNGLRRFEQSSIVDRYDTIIRDLDNHR